MFSRKAISILISVVMFLVLILFLMQLLLPGIVEKNINQVDSTVLAPVDATANRLHKQLWIADLHADSLLWGRDLNFHSGIGHVDFPRLLQANVALQVFTTVTKSPRNLNYQQNSSAAVDNITLLALAQGWPFSAWTNLTERALYQASRLKNFIEQAPPEQQILLVTDQKVLAELVSRRQAGEPVVGVMLGTEGSHALEGRLTSLDTLHHAGFRMMSLQHFFDNRLGGSLHGENQQGLTAFGQKVVQRMRELSIVIDVSHSSIQVVKDVMALDSRPLIVSHTGSFGHCPRQRNLPDDLLTEVSRRGGLIGIGFWSEAVCGSTVKDIAEAIVYAVRKFGVHAVALGSDFDGAVTTPIDVSALSSLTAELLLLDLNNEEIASVMGGNVLRFLQDNLPAGE